jgi:molybdopterin-containing oxidoreductase family membrane subunit
MTIATMTRPGSILLVATVGILVTGALVLSTLSSTGHAAFNTSNLGLYWGLPIVIYDYFLLTSTGLAMVAALALAFGGDECVPVVKRCVWLALAGFAGAAVTLGLELGHPLRAIYAIPANLQVASPLFWKVVLVLGYLAVLITLFLRLGRADWSPASVRPLAVAVLVAALGVTAVAGGVYGTMSMRPFWASGDVPVAFVVESLLGGLAFAVFFTYLAYGFDQAAMPESLRKLFTGTVPSLFALAILAHALFVAARVITGLYGNAEGLQVWGHIVRSPLFHLEVWLGLALPLVLMLRSASRGAGGAQVASALLVVVSLFISRYEYIIGGQLVPPFKGSWAPALLDYVPSVTEWLLLALALFVANAVYALGEWLFRLSACPGRGAA